MRPLPLLLASRPNAAVGHERAIASQKVEETGNITANSGAMLPGVK
jgi:hypothetical protein